MTIRGAGGDISAASVRNRSGFIQRGRQVNMEFSCCLSFTWVRGSTGSIIILNGNGGKKTMRIALHDSDKTKFPNLALMKLSAFHKSRGDVVEWFNPMFQYDKIYSSKVFTFTPEDAYLPVAAIRGALGTITMSSYLLLQNTSARIMVYIEIRSVLVF
ncbi:MAG: hypothetical protein KAI73_09110 [Rhodospirillaceae bacterium]|nr:hypothetical protein [Rhodospirillaceae bacterium]